jgi:pyruvate/2-oxoglutarate dehydrogenase complex dihydrolipoamide dehydrogenase (E3) component
MAQAFARFGSKVTLIESGPRLLPKDDPEAVEVVTRILTGEDGVRLLLNTEILQVSSTALEKSLTIRQNQQQLNIPCDAILVAAGRTPRLEALQGDHADVRLDPKLGVLVNDFLQTSNPRIYASGDVCSAFRFTHAADFMSRIVIQNSLFMGRARFSRLLIPWCTYTSPEIAHVGMTSQEAAGQGIAITTVTQPFSGNDRAILESRDEGFVRLHLKQGTDRILGATIVSEHAGDLISELTVAMSVGAGAGKIASVIHPYPTQADAIRRLGDTCNKRRLTPLIQRLFRTWLTWRPFW